MAPEVNSKLIAGHSTSNANSKPRRSSVSVGDTCAGTSFTIAEENLLLLGLQVIFIVTQILKPKTLPFSAFPMSSTEIWSRLSRHQRHINAKQACRSASLSLQGTHHPPYSSMHAKTCMCDRQGVEQQRKRVL
jgi:hypothetical protein